MGCDGNEADQSNGISEGDWLARALRSIADSRISKSQKKEATWVAMRVAMSTTPKGDSDSCSGIEKETNLLAETGGTCGTADEGIGSPDNDHNPEQGKISVDDIFNAEIDDRMQCIRPVIAHAVMQAHGQLSATIAHADTLRRNVALHAFDGIGNVSSLTMSQLRHAQKGILKQMDRFEKLEAEIVELKELVSAAGLDETIVATQAPQQAAVTEASTAQKAETEFEGTTRVVPASAPAKPHIMWADCKADEEFHKLQQALVEPSSADATAAEENICTEKVLTKVSVSTDDPATTHNALKSKKRDSISKGRGATQSNSNPPVRGDLVHDDRNASDKGKAAAKGKRARRRGEPPRCFNDLPASQRAYIRQKLLQGYTMEECLNGKAD